MTRVNLPLTILCMARRGPTQCIQSKPDKKHHPISLSGVYINLQQIERDHGLDPGYVSRILSGKANPTRDYLTKLAAALGMTVSNLLISIDERVAESQS